MTEVCAVEEMDGSGECVVGICEGVRSVAEEVVGFGCAVGGDGVDGWCRTWDFLHR